MIGRARSRRACRAGERRSMVATAGLVELITEPHHSAANAPAVIHTVANTGESRKVAFVAPGTFGVCMRRRCWQRRNEAGCLSASFFSPRYDKKAAPCGAAESDREEVKVNLLVHMDARGTTSVYPHLGIRATYFTRWPWPGLRGATHLDDCLGPGHCFALGYVARLSPLLR
jgi:hypothetical protein